MYEVSRRSGMETLAKASLDNHKAASPSPLRVSHARSCTEEYGFLAVERVAFSPRVLERLQMLYFGDRLIVHFYHSHEYLVSTTTACLNELAFAV